MNDNSTCEAPGCTRKGILTCQYVIPNKLNKATQKLEFNPWVFRYHYCRYHLAGQNNPRRHLYEGPLKRLEYDSDESLIQKWTEEKQKDGRLTEGLGWQKLPAERIILTQFP